MKEYTVKIHYTDKDGTEQTFISEKLANNKSEASAKATKLFREIKNPSDSIISIEVDEFTVSIKEVWIKRTDRKDVEIIGVEYARERLFELIHSGYGVSCSVKDESGTLYVTLSKEIERRCENA